MEETKYYLITFGSYHDCPTCDGFTSEPEDLEFEKVCGIEGIKKFIEERFGYSKLYCLFLVKDYGELEFVADFTMETGGHQVQGVKFTLNDELHHYIRDKKLGKVWATKAYKTLYGKA